MSIKVNRVRASNVNENCACDDVSSENVSHVNNDVYVENDAEKTAQIKHLIGANNSHIEGLTRFRQDFSTASKLMTPQEFEGLVEVFRTLLQWQKEEELARKGE